MKKNINNFLKKMLARCFRSSLRRPYEIYPEQIFLVGFQKSGNNWLRFLIWNLIYPDDPISFANAEKKIPYVYSNLYRQFFEAPKPRMYSSHEVFDPRYKKVIYIVRDPRDVAVSLYHHFIKFGKIQGDRSVSEFIPDFIDDDLYSWGDNVGSWIGARGLDSERFLLIRYEDLLTSAFEELKKIAGYLSIDVNDGRIRQAISASSFDNMRASEVTDTSNMFDRGPLQKGNKGKNFVRKGVSGGWKDEMSEGDAKLIEERWGPLMRELGYLD